MNKSPLFKLVLHQVFIPFKVKFSHASAERAETSSIWVEAIAKDGLTGYGESCPRKYVTGETIESAKAFFKQYHHAICDEVNSLSTLRAWVKTYEKLIDTNPAGWCAIELAILDLLAKQNNITIEQLLNLPALDGSFQYSAVLGDAPKEVFALVAEQYLQQGFTDLKLKLSGDIKRDQDKIAVIKSWKGSHLRVRADANNLWKNVDTAIAFLQSLDYPFFAIEEPLQPNAYSSLHLLANTIGCKIILDESFLRLSQFELLPDSPEHWIINLRISKMGGLIRSLSMIEQAKELEIGLIIGAQVGETSLLTRAGLTAAVAASDFLIAQEGAFGTHLLESDIFSPSLMFGKSGLLNVAHHPNLLKSGLGIFFDEKPQFISQLD